jgi:predicted dehydrogenase
MKEPIRIALVGLSEAGEVFAEHLLEKAQEHDVPIDIVAIADMHPDSAVALGFSQNGVPVYTDAREIAKLGDAVDIIFELSGRPSVRQELRLALLEHKNIHTVLASEVMARLLWYFFGEKGELPVDPTRGY